MDDMVVSGRLIVRNVSTSLDQMISSSSLCVLGGDGIRTGSTLASNDVDANVLESNSDGCERSLARGRLTEEAKLGGDAACVCRRTDGLPCELALELVRLRVPGDCSISAPSIASPLAEVLSSGSPLDAFNEALDTLRVRFRDSRISESSTVVP